MPRAVHQFVPTYEPGAVGAHLAQVQRLLQDRGYESDVFTEHLHPSLEGRAQPFTHYGREVPARADDVLLYQSAIGSVVGDFVLNRPEPLVINHHNITPIEYFAAWEPDIIWGLQWGFQQLEALAPRTRLAIAVSEFNRADLAQLGYADTAVVPILLDPAELLSEPDPGVVARLATARAAGGAQWLFVGRVAPNKAQHDLVKAFALYRRVYDPAARLQIVGGPASASYWGALERFVRVLGLGEAVELAGPMSSGGLAAAYAHADVFVCLSEHEGFCVPLLEAMLAELPIVAYAAAAVPETLGDAGVLLAEKGPATVAAAVHRVMNDAALRAGLVAAGTARVFDFALDRTREQFMAALEPVLQ
ncbi:MAG: hypothetical protein JWL73_3567 [Actinomycetia bacterium]|nr:hypothetical protein [Actinomycetes bacterium]